MGDTRKKPVAKTKFKKRIIRKSPDPLSKLDMFYIAKHEIFKAARKAGFTESVALYLMDNPESMPDWIVGDKGIIPTIDPTEGDDD